MDGREVRRPSPHSRSSRTMIIRTDLAYAACISETKLQQPAPWGVKGTVSSRDSRVIFVRAGRRGRHEAARGWGGPSRQEIAASDN